VPRLRHLLALALALLWLPATLHCDLEAAGLGQAFGCHEESAHDPHHCSDDSCHAIESLTYKIDTAPVKILPPALGLFNHCPLSPAPLFAPPVGELSVCRPSEPPPLARHWRFARRAAPPARAPSCLV